MTSSRRDFLKLAVGLGVGTTAASLVVLGGCNQKPAELSCTDTTGLTPDELATRTQFKYVDRSPEAEKQCRGCQLYQPKSPETCGGCLIVKGPVHPQGYCSSWVKKVG